MLVTLRCSDPLHRRSVRVSTGTVFQVPWSRIESWPRGVAELHTEAFTVAALELSDDSVTLGEFVDQGNEKVAFVSGTRGTGSATRRLLSRMLW